MAVEDMAGSPYHQSSRSHTRRILPSLAFVIAILFLFLKLPGDVSEIARRNARPESRLEHRRGSTVDLTAIPSEPVNHVGAVGTLKQVIMKKGQVPHMNTFGRASVAPGGSVPEHIHPDMDEIFHCIAGAGVITVDGDEVDMKRGITVHVAAGQSHSLRNYGKSNWVLMYWGIEAEQTFSV